MDSDVWVLDKESCVSAVRKVLVTFCIIAGLLEAQHGTLFSKRLRKRVQLPAVSARGTDLEVGKRRSA